MFGGLHLLDFAAVDANGQLPGPIHPASAGALELSSGMFLFSK
jgi:hypothetical protein